MHKNIRFKQRCGECGALFEDGEEIYVWDNRYVCCECFDNLFAALSRTDKALRGGIVVTNYPISE